MNDFERALRALGRARVKFSVIGGLAATLHGSAHVTFDLDICYDRSSANLERLSQALKPFKPRLRDAPASLPFRLDPATLARGMNFTLTTDVGDFDLFGEVVGIGDYRQVLALSIDAEAYGQRISVLSLDGLIRSKRASGRKK